MSSQLNVSNTVEQVQHAVARHRDHVPEAHPRRAGFGVLSRLARKRAEDLEDYAPRHRSDNEPDAFSAVG